ncbi:MAG: Flagellar basal-body rod protein FlgG [Firmicutes bacterium]|nr:Flagellar basal-body rod protein FlgG [candidate division NPL-UPA2 bacterium]
MLQSIRRSVSGLVAQMNRLTSISSNIANAKTAGHKRQSGTFSELLVQAFDERNVPLLSPQGRFVHGVEYRPETVFSQGDLVPTGRALDIALDGSGFMELSDARGQPVFVRGGSFSLDAGGRLVHSSGAAVPGVTIPVEAQVIDIDSQGVITYAVDGAVNVGGELRVVSFVNPAGLNHLGQLVFARGANSGEATADSSVVKQGFLESSNVSLLHEMTELVRAQRMYQTNAAAVRTLDEMWERSTDLRR